MTENKNKNFENIDNLDDINRFINTDRQNFATVIVITIISFLAFVILIAVIITRGLDSGSISDVIDGTNVVAFIEAKNIKLPFDVDSRSVNKIGVALLKSHEIIYIIGTKTNISAISLLRSDTIKNFHVARVNKYLILSRNKNTLDNLISKDRKKLSSNKDFINARSEVPSKDNMFFWIDANMAKSMFSFDSNDKNITPLDNIINSVWSEINNFAGGLVNVRSNISRDVNILRARTFFKDEKFVYNGEMRNNMYAYIPVDVDFMLAGNNISSQYVNIEDMLEKKAPSMFIGIKNYITYLDLSFTKLNRIFRLVTGDWSFSTKNDKWMFVLENTDEKMENEINSLLKVMLDNLPARFPKIIDTALPNGKLVQMLDKNYDIVSIEDKNGLKVIDIKVENKNNKQIVYGIKDNFIFLSNSFDFIKDAYNNKVTFKDRLETKEFVKHADKYMTSRGFISKKIITKVLPNWLKCVVKNNLSNTEKCEIGNVYFAKWSVLKQDYWAIMGF